MSRRKALRDNRNRGAALVVVLCIMAVLMALSVALLLTASTTIGTARNRVVNERCKAMTATMSQVIADQICDEEIAEELGKSYTTDYSMLVPKVSYTDTIQEFLRNKMMKFVKGEDTEWPYFDESGYLESVVPDEYIRKFDMSDILAGESSELEGYKLSVEMYWTAVESSLEEGSKAEPEGVGYDYGEVILIVIVQCTKEEQMQRVVISYSLDTELKSYIIREADPENPEEFTEREVEYAIWKWSKNDKT